MRSTRKLAAFLRPYWRLVIIGPLLMLLEVVMDLMQPRLLQHIVDVGLRNLDMSVVVRTGLLMVALALVGAVGGIVNTLVAVRASIGVGADLRSALFHKVQSLSFANLDRLGTGSLVTRLTNDVTQIQDVLLILLRIMVRIPLLLVGSLVMAVFTSPSLSLMFLVLGPFLLGLLAVVFRGAHPKFTLVQERLDRLNTVIQENLAGVRVVKAFARGEHEKARFGAANGALMTSTVGAFRLVSVIFPGMMIAVNFGVVAVLWFGGSQVIRGQMEVGQIMAFVNYLLQALFSLMMGSMLAMRISRAGASADRVLEVLESEPAITDRLDAVAEFAPRGEVVFEHVTFGYNGDEAEPVLQDVSFTARPGQMVAMLGETGAGKSSLVHLIPRFYDVKSGRVALDGLDVRELKQDALRRHIGIALQEAILFTGTVRDNIRFGRPEASDEEVIAAAKAAQAHDFIMALPDGYDTWVGQRGVNLSGGQKQRIAIARALLINPAVLILDDSTSAVDVETEARIQEALDEFMAGRTCLIIAQRISTVLNADKILVLDGGRVVAEGTHQELMCSSPIYREIYESQLGGSNHR